eukprot:1161474-Pelagomonas_calceolata.AAC.15
MPRGGSNIMLGLWRVVESLLGSATLFGMGHIHLSLHLAYCACSSSAHVPFIDVGRVLSACVALLFLQRRGLHGSFFVTVWAAARTAVGGPLCLFYLPGAALHACDDLPFSCIAVPHPGPTSIKRSRKNSTCHHWRHA